MTIASTRSLAERRQRKSLGAYYSPASLAEPMVSWALPQAGDSVLDPSCGDGVFLEAAARRLLHLGASAEAVAARLHGVDLDLEAVAGAAGRLAGFLGSRPPHLQHADFFSLPSPGTQAAFPGLQAEVVLLLADDQREGPAPRLVLPL